MKDKDKTKGQLLKELSELSKRVVELEKSEIKRKKAEEKLKNLEERLKILFEYAPDAYYLNDLKGTLLDGNKVAEKLIGYKKEEIVGKSFLKLKMLSPDQIPKAAALLVKNKLRKSTGPDEFILNRKDGNQVPVEIRTIPVKIKGEFLVLGIARDITERKKSEERLRESEEKFRNIVELSPDGILIIDLKGVITTCNPAFLSLTGFSKKEIVGKHFTKLPTLRRRHVKDIPKYIKMFNTILTGEVPKPLEMTWLHKDGNARLGEFHVSLMKKDRKTIGIQVIARDITERRQAEEALRESEETLRATIDSSRDWIWSIDIEGNHIYSNPAIEEILGYSPDELIGKPSLDLMHPEDRREIEGMLPRWIKEKQGWQNLVIRWHHKDGSLRWLESNAVPIFDSEGSLIGFRGVDRDITERRRAEEEIRKESDKAQKYLNVARVIIVALNSKAEVTLINKKGCEILGFKEEDILGKNWFNNFLPDGMRDEVKNIFKKLMSGEIELAEYHENPLLTKRGIQRTIAWQNTILKDETGKIIGALSSGEDITDRKKAEEALVIQNKYNELRAEIWEKASDPSLKEERDLIQVLLNTVGPAVDVSRAAYLPFVPERKAYVTQLQWYKKEVGDSLGEDISPDIAKYFYGRNHIEIPTDIDKIIKIPGIRPTIKLYMFAKLKKHNIKSYLVVPYGDINKPKGLFTFSECEKDREWSDLEKNILSEVVNIVTMKVEQIRAAERVKASLKEKEVLLQEIHHRVKNNMQIISSLLRLQSRHIHDEQALKMFTSTQSRVQSMAIIHERLYRSKDFAKVDFGEYIKILTSNLFSAYGINPRSVKLHLNIKDVSLDINTAIPCGLIVNELVSNALKHAFFDGKKGEIKITMHPLNKKEVELIVSDNGIGLPEKVDFRNTESLGLHLVAILAEDQLRGNIKLDRKKGTSFHLRLGVR